jgi:UDP-N-acetylglucosamine acyltransferase
MTLIHPTSVVENGAQIGPDARIGPFCHIGAEVALGAGSALASHVSITGKTRIGAGLRASPFVAIGGPAQDLKSDGASGALEIGADCLLREGVTINAGTPGGGGVTRIGDGCALLAAAHVAHDCVLGDRVVLSNAVLLGGHVVIGDDAMIGGGAAVHQYVRIGAQAFIAGLAGVEGDVIPFGLAGGDRARLAGLNVIGLQRRGFSAERIAGLRAAYRALFAREAASSLGERIEAVAQQCGDDAGVASLLAFLRAPSQRPLCAPRALED